MFVDAPLPFLAAIEAEWKAIRDEYSALPRDAFEPWVQREMYGEGWSVYGLVAFGRRIDAALGACPRTARALANVPRLTTAGFSRLAPSTHIKPHRGWVTTVYRAHLALVVARSDEACAMRVANETRAWKEGRCVVFDDTSEHEAWNRTDAERVVLLFDFVRPGLPDDIAMDEPPPEVRAMIDRR